MTKKQLKKQSISSFFSQDISDQSRENFADITVREAFLRSVRNTLDNFGIDQNSIERVWGQVEMLEQFYILTEDIRNTK